MSDAAPLITTPRNTTTVPSGTVALGEVESKVGAFKDWLERARFWSLIADTISRVVMVLVIAGIFIGLNWEVMSLVGHAFDQDIMMMQKFPQTFKPSDRVISANVFMSLIGATVVQVGVATVAIVSYLFPKKPPDTDASK